MAFGTGFTGRRGMGYGSIPWSYMTAYINAYCGLLRGDVVEWDGARMQMLHLDGIVPPRPIDVPILIGALGPKGRAVAESHDGVFALVTLEGLQPGAFLWVAFVYWGTVLEPGEDVASDRVRAAAVPGGAFAHHATYELYGRDAVESVPGGGEWLKVDRRAGRGRTTPRRTRCWHHGSQRSRPGRVAATEGALLPSTTVTGTPEQVKARIDDLGEKGVTEVVFQPCGPDTRRELAAMFAAAT